MLAKIAHYKSTKTQGFTLIELMIVIAIIAVLAVIGAVLYGGAQKSSRDSRRLADINAIADAMEAQYGKGSNSGQYQALAGNFFSNGQIPIDPLTNSNGTANNSCNGKICNYCVLNDSSAANPSPTNCTNQTVVAASHPAGGSNYWMVCANLEGTINNLTYYCRANQQ